MTPDIKLFFHDPRYETIFSYDPEYETIFMIGDVKLFSLHDPRYETILIL